MRLVRRTGPELSVGVIKSFKKEETCLTIGGYHESNERRTLGISLALFYQIGVHDGIE
jgi:hypothetical protein